MSEPAADALNTRYRPRIEAELAELDALSAAGGEDRRPVALDQQSVGRVSRIDSLQVQAMAQAADRRRAARRGGQPCAALWRGWKTASPAGAANAASSSAANA